MKKSMRKALALVLALLMTVPLMALGVSADEPANSDGLNGTLLKTLDFDSAEWIEGFASDSNKGADVEILNDGASAKLTIHENNNRRAMWGGLTDAASANLPWGAGTNYTFVLDITFSGTNKDYAAAGLHIDGGDAFAIDGSGNIYWYSWNTKVVDNVTDNGAKKWTEVTDVDPAAKQTFAVEVVHDTNTMNIFVKKQDGSFALVQSMVCMEELLDGAWNPKTEANEPTMSTLAARLYVRNMNSEFKADNVVEVGNVRIYDGLTVMEEYRNTPATLTGTLLKTFDFDSAEWGTEFASDSNKGADVEVLNGGASAKLTIHENNNRRAMWGGLTDAASASLTWGAGTNYTFVLDLTFSGTNGAYAAAGVQVDGGDSFVIDGSGNVYWYSWNTKVVDNVTDAGAAKWTDVTDVEPTAKQTFAIEVEHDTRKMNVFVKKLDGTFAFVQSMECMEELLDGAWNPKTETNEPTTSTLSGRLYVRNMNSEFKADNVVEFGNVRIYDGITVMDAYRDTMNQVPSGGDGSGDGAGDSNSGASNNQTGDTGTKKENKAPVLVEDETEAETEAETATEEKGCGGSIALGGVALVMTVVGIAGIAVKKNDEE